MNTAKLFLVLGLVILIVGVGAAIRYQHDEAVANASGPENRAGSVSDGPLADSSDGVVCTGYVDLEHGIRSLAPLRPGRVAAILVQETQQVESGTPLLRLEDEDAKFQLALAESAVTAAEVQVDEALKLEEQQRARLEQQQAAIAAAGFRLEAARETLRRKEDQLKKGVILDEEASVTRAEVKALAEQQRAERAKLAELKTIDPALALRQAKAKREQARIQRDQARRQLDECTLKAPAAGTIQRIAVGAGDIVTGNPAQPIVRFCPDEPPLVRANVDQEFADRIQVGQAALIRDDARAGANWRGKVQRIAGWYEHQRLATQDPSAFTDVRTVECLIAIDPGQPPLRLGQRMRVMIGRVPSPEGN